MELVFGTENFSKLIMFSHFFVKNTNFALMWVMLNFRRTHYGFKMWAMILWGWSLTPTSPREALETGIYFYWHKYLTNTEDTILPNNMTNIDGHKYLAKRKLWNTSIWNTTNFDKKIMSYARHIEVNTFSKFEKSIYKRRKAKYDNLGFIRLFLLLTLLPRET